MVTFLHLCPFLCACHTTCAGLTSRPPGKPLFKHRKKKNQLWEGVDLSKEQWKADDTRIEDCYEGGN